MRRIKQGSETALQELMLHAAHVLERLAESLLYDKGLAADVVQETFISVWTHRHEYDERMPAWPWIARILRNKCHAVWRKAGGRRHDGPIRGEPLVDLAEFVPSPLSWQEQEHEKAQLMQMARDCILQLSPACREVVQLFLFSDLPEREIAHLLGVPLGTVKSRKNRGLSILRSKLGST